MDNEPRKPRKRVDIGQGFQTDESMQEFHELNDMFEEIDRRRGDPNRPERPNHGPRLNAQQELRRPTEQQLARALETGDFAGMDLRGNFNGYKSLAHMQRDGQVTARELITPEAMHKHYMHTYGPPAHDPVSVQQQNDLATIEAAIKAGKSTPGYDPSDDLMAKDAMKKAIGVTSKAREDWTRKAQVGFSQRMAQNEKENGGIQINLSNANLSGVNLSGADFHGDTTHINKVRLDGAQLQQTNLTGANLSSQYLQGANLTNAILNKTSLEGSMLNNAIVTGADFKEAKLRDAVLDGVELQNAKNVPELTKPKPKKSLKDRFLG